MRRRRVTAPTGEQWTIVRRWVPRLGDESWTRRFRRRFGRVARRTGDFADVPGGCGGDLGEAIVVFIIGIVVVALIVFVAVPLAVAVVDLLIVVVLTIAGTLGRLLFGRPWLIEAWSGDVGRASWRVAGWRASRAKIEEISTQLAAGLPLPATHRPPPATFRSPPDQPTAGDHSPR